MKKNINRQLKLSVKFTENELERKLLKLMTSNAILPLSTRNKLVENNSLVSSSLGISKLRRVCRLTGRSRGILKDFGISRIQWKELFNEGLINGSRKSSW